MATVQVRLLAMTVRTEAHRVHVDPACARCPQFYPYRQPVRLGRVAELVEHPQAAAQVLRVDGQVKIPVLPGLPPGQCSDSPAATHPMTNPGTIQLSTTSITSSARMRQANCAVGEYSSPARPR